MRLPVAVYFAKNMSDPPEWPKVVTPGPGSKPRVLEEEVQSLTVAAGAYSVQVGAFSSRANAQNLAGKLNIKGYPAFIVQSSAGAKPLFKVRVGHFPDLAEAKNAERQLRLDGYPTKIIP